MKKLFNFLSVLGLSTLVAGCLVSCSKDESGKTSHPGMGVIEIIPEWRACEEAFQELPSTYRVQVGEMTKEMETGNSCFPALLPPKTYELTACNEAAHVSVKGPVATVDQVEDSSLHASPGFLFSTRTEVTVLEDDTVRVTLPMKQHVRRLALTVFLHGDVGTVKSLTATLNGVAGSIRLFESKLEGEAMTVKIPMAKISHTEGEFTGSCRILGILPEEKAQLKLYVEYADGQGQEVESDMTELFKDFKDGTETFSVEGELEIEKQVDGCFHGTIIDWKKKDEYVEIENK